MLDCVLARCRRKLCLFFFFQNSTRCPSNVKGGGGIFGSLLSVVFCRGLHLPSSQVHLFVVYTRLHKLTCEELLGHLVLQIAYPTNCCICMFFYLLWENRLAIVLLRIVFYRGLHLPCNQVHLFVVYTRFDKLTCAGLLGHLVSQITDST